ncbi:type II secretion system F family protein [Aquipuribacter hungaricus]|uniref:Type II secretion system F family protein n=1 Tax=Aquipuribacter hungaricus TaxID=545624 RepID=A0ABV7WIV9_9MICO
MVLLTVALSLLSVAFLVLALRELVATPVARRRAMASVLDTEGPNRGERWARADASFRRTRLGRLLERELALAGLRRSPLLVLVVAVSGALVLATTVWVALAPALGVLSLLAGFLLVRAYLARARERRREAFIAQMPELARVLANATNAGLSIPTAIALAADELDAPAREELRRVSTSLTFGNDLETALDGIRERLPSREVGVLLSTLLVSARSGGSLVTALRDIAGTLEVRKETRREIRTTLAQSVATGYIVIALGVGLLLLINVLFPGSVEQMTQRLVGQVALLGAAVLYAAGFLLIRRMTRMDV